MSAIKQNKSDKFYLLEEYSIINENTICLIDISEFLLVPEQYRKNCIVINSKKLTEKNISECLYKDIFDISFLPKSAEKLLKQCNENVFNFNRSIKFSLIDLIIEDSSTNTTSKYLWTVIQGSINALKTIKVQDKRLIKTSSLTISKQQLFSIMSNLYKSNLSKDKFNKMISVFEKSILCKKVTDKNITIKGKKELISKEQTGVLTELFLSKNEGFTEKDFLHKCIIFSYSKPLSNGGRLISTISQDTISKYYQLNASNISYHTNGMLKAIKFELITEEEANRINYERHAFNSNEYAFLSGASGAVSTIRNEDGTLQNINYYVKVIGSKLFAQFNFGSYYKTRDNTFVNLKTKLFKSQKRKEVISKDGRETLKKNYGNHKLEVLTTENKLQYTSHFNLIDLVERYEARRTLCKLGTSNTELTCDSYSTISKESFQFQLVYKSGIELKNKVQYFISTLGMINVIKEHLNFNSFNTKFHTLSEQNTIIMKCLYKIMKDQSTDLFTKKLISKNINRFKDLYSKFKISTMKYISNTKDSFVQLIDDSIINSMEYNSQALVLSPVFTERRED